jgi:two-component system, chemotaxis family, protein-glutamate methylesterase/glutaminase
MSDKHKSRSTRKADDVFHHDGEPSVFTCPDCSGTLFLVKQNSIVQFKCRIGHRYSLQSMSEAQGEYVERALWTALRALEEHAEFSRQMAQAMRNADGGEEQKRYNDQSQTALKNSKIMRQVIEDMLKKVGA